MLCWASYISANYLTLCYRELEIIYILWFVIDISTLFVSMLYKENFSSEEFQGISENNFDANLVDFINT